MSSLKKYIKLFLNRHQGLRKIARKTYTSLREKRYESRTGGIEVDEKLVLFETFMGRQYGCNPRAIYEQMLADDRFADYRFAWALNEPERAKEFPELERAEVVPLLSDRYFELCAAAGHIITNSNLDYGIVKRPGQTFVQTWHGTPLKRLRCDITAESGNINNSLEEIRTKNDGDVVRYDYFLSPSRFASEKFRSAFRMDALGISDIIAETGYPRNDILYNYTETQAEEIRRSLGIPDGRKIILYAPTFRDNKYNGEAYVYDLHLNFDRLREVLGDEYVVLFRAHYFVAKQFDFAAYEGFAYDVSELDDISPLYLISDMLITDYSSVFFDYANLKRPMLFYMYDLDEYADDIRGFYIDISELPGPVVRSEDELMELLDGMKKETGSDDYFSRFGQAYEEFNGKYNYLDDGSASKRVIDLVFDKGE